MKGLVSNAVRIEPVCLADILLAIELCPVEISGYARAKEVGDAIVIYGEPEIFKQNCSMDGTEFDLEAHGLWEYGKMKSGRGEEINEFRLWWHSHVYSRAYFSGTDKHMIASREGTGAKWWVSLVGNKHGNLSFRTDLYGETRTTLVPQVSSTEKIDKEAMKALMISRQSRMVEIICKNVRIDGNHWLERILTGVFG